eukprot:gb/GECG01011967.1/.p1 GENE.gb/GECG01011967.1/~~gb/GECG01011967.1/.p1  ORF type:complete len:386 (+),score=57.93 gb/GECG01011967.1/:1-1158(+)
MASFHPKNQDHHLVLPLGDSGSGADHYTTTATAAFNDIYKPTDSKRRNPMDKGSYQPTPPWARDDDPDQPPTQITSQRKHIPQNENYPPPGAGSFQEDSLDREQPMEREPLPHERFGKKVNREAVTKEEPDGRTHLPFPPRYPEAGVHLSKENVGKSTNLDLSQEDILSRYSKRHGSASSRGGNSTRLDDFQYDPRAARYQSVNGGDFRPYDEEQMRLMRGHRVDPEYADSKVNGRGSNRNASEVDDEGDNEPDYDGIGNALHTPFGRTDDQTMQRILRRQEQEQAEMNNNRQKIGKGFTTNQSNFRQFSGDEIEKIRNVSAPFNYRDPPTVDTTQKEGSAASSRNSVMRDEFPAFDPEAIKMARANFGASARNKAKQSSQILLG